MVVCSKCRSYSCGGSRCSKFELKVELWGLEREIWGINVEDALTSWAAWDDAQSGDYTIVRDGELSVTVREPDGEWVEYRVVAETVPHYTARPRCHAT